MSAQPHALITNHLENAIAAERTFEARLRGFALHGDDEEVQSAFAVHADHISADVALLIERLGELASSVSEPGTSLANTTDVAPELATSGVVEEQTLQNLITACTIGATECAAYTVLATVAQAAGDDVTETLALEIKERRVTATERVWHFLPSRTKIAFNMLTLDEVDPAVTTRALENRLIE